MRQRKAISLFSMKWMWLTLRNLPDCMICWTVRLSYWRRTVEKSFRYIRDSGLLLRVTDSAGAGDGSGLYQGVLRQSPAWLDRFRVIEVDYPDEFTELMILNQVVPDLPVLVREKMVKLANEVRRLFTGLQEGESQLSVTLSTRGLVRWARLSLRFQGAPRVFEYAPEQALTGRVEPAERQAIHRIGHDVFVELWSSGVES